jgi:hypothetical protein
MNDGILTKAVAVIITLAVLVAFAMLSPIIFAIAFGFPLLMALLIMVVNGPRELLGEFWDAVTRS